MEEQMLLADDFNERDTEETDVSQQAAEIERLRKINKTLRRKY